MATIIRNAAQLAEAQEQVARKKAEAKALNKAIRDGSRYLEMAVNALIGQVTRELWLKGTTPTPEAVLAYAKETATKRQIDVVEQLAIVLGAEAGAPALLAGNPPQDQVETTPPTQGDELREDQDPAVDQPEPAHAAPVSNGGAETTASDCPAVVPEAASNGQSDANPPVPRPFTAWGKPPRAR